MHTLRLGYQGRELLRRAGSACRSEEGRRRVFPVRKGEVEFNDVLTGIGEPERTLEDLRETAWLPPEPDYGASQLLSRDCVPRVLELIRDWMPRSRGATLQS